MILFFLLNMSEYTMNAIFPFWYQMMILIHLQNRSKNRRTFLSAIPPTMTFINHGTNELSFVAIAVGHAYLMIWKIFFFLFISSNKKNIYDMYEFEFHLFLVDYCIVQSSVFVCVCMCVGSLA